MKYGRIFENENIEDLTHEVLTYHGIHFSEKNWMTGNPLRLYYGNTNNDDLHDSLTGIGWKKHSVSSYIDDPDDVPDAVESGFDVHVYHHPDHAGELHVNHTWNDGGPIPEDMNTHMVSFHKRGSAVR